MITLLLASLMAFVILPFNSLKVYASEYYDLGSVADTYELGSEVEISVTPRKFVSSKWSSWSNHPNFIYVRIYKDSEAEPCKSSTFSYNTNGASIKEGYSFFFPEAVGKTRTSSFTPEAAGVYTVKILWQNYDSYDKRTDPELMEQFTFTVEEPGQVAGTANEIVDLPAVKIAKPKAAKKSAVVKWIKISSKNKKKIAGIEIQYSQDKNFKTGVKIKTAKKSAASKKITKLKSKKKYYFRIRTYKKVKGVKHVSKWSAPKSVKVK